MSVGNATKQRQIVNVAAGTQDNDAVNLGQMNAALATKADDTLSKVRSMGTTPTPATAATDNAIAIGGGAYANNTFAGGTIVNGGAVAIGERASAAAGGATAVGGYSRADTFGSAFGDQASASGESSSAFGAYAKASAKDSVALGAGSIADRDNTVSVGSTTLGRQIVNVAAGTQQNDAVNVGQLGGVVDALGGGARVNPDGSIEAPTYSVGGTNVRTIGDAVSNLDGRVTGNTGAISDLKDQLANSGLVDPDTGAPIAAVTYDDPTKASVTLGGAGATGPVALKNVAAATDGTDAVNYDQLQDYVAKNGGTNPLSVSYDDDTKGSLTLGGTGATAPVALKNVAAGVDDHDAVNVAQLKSSGLVGDDGSGNLTSLAVSYDSTARNQVTLGGTGTAPVALKNVAKGVDGTDAVNVDQLTGATQSIRDDLAAGTLDMRYIKVNATGVQANAAGANSVAIGSGANANGVGALALGTGARAQGVNAVALGFNSVATQANTVSVGRAGAERKIVNVAGGDVSADSTDAINGSQLYDALNSLSSTFDQKAQQIASNSLNSMGIMDVTDPLVAIEGVRGNNTASLNGSDPATTTAVAVGSSSVAAGGNAVAVGLQNVAGSNNAVAIGSFAQTGADSDYATAIGSNVQATGSEAVAIGANVEAGANNALVIGSNNAQAIGAGSIALGDSARVNAGGENSIAVGTNAAVARNVTNALALGAGATVAAGANGGVALGQGSVANRGNAVSVGSAATQRQIINVAAGTAATDAVNVGQLSGLTSALGGGSAVGANGAITQPTYTVGGTAYHNVGEALAALEANGGSDPNAVAYDDDTRSSVTLGGTAATDAVALKNVAAGTVSATSTDAINGSQLHGTAQSVADALGGGATVGADGKVEAPTYTVGGTDVRTVGDALSNLDGRTTANTGDISDLKDKLADSGLVDPATGKAIAAVTYDRDATGATNFDSLTLAGGTNGTVIHNVGAGEVSATSKDAVNGSQLFATNQQVGDLKDKLSEGGVFDPTTGESLAVTYTNADRTEVKLGADGTPVRVTNVADAQADNDAVNLKQLKDAGLVAVDPTDPDAGLKSLAVTYDKDPSGAANFDSLTLAGGANGTVIHNVGAGEVSATSKDAINGSQLHGTAQSVADALGGGAAVGADGKVGAPTYTIGGTDMHNVGDALSNLDGRTTANTGDISDLKDKLADSGLVDPDTGKAIAAVTYDNDAKNSVTLGGTGSTTPVALKNVADGVDDHDAVNVSQLKTAGLVGEGDDGNLTSLAVAYDGTGKDKVTLAGADGTTITNLKAGAVNGTSTDAINGSQLYGTAQSVADALGGGATVGADGKVGAPTYTIGGTDMHNVGDALSNLDGRTTANTGDLADLKDKLSEGGVIDPTTGESLAVTYTNADRTEVKLGADGTPVRVTNVADAQADNDAVNLKQLKDAGLVAVDPTDPDAGLKSLAVTYDKDPSGAANFDSLTLAGGVDGTVIHNVGAGELSATSKDAVNGSQLFETNEQVGNLRDKLADSGLVDPATGKAIAAVTYDNDEKNSVTLGGAGSTTPVALKNVADGVDDHDAVNVSQLKAVGNVVDDGKGNLTSLAVAYDGIEKDKVSLAGTDGTTITNLKAGTVSATSTDAINGSQLHGTAQSVADALGGGATVGADGKIEAPTYTVGGTDVRTVGDALSNLDGRTTANTGDISDLKDKLADSGLVDPATGNAIAAVTYDSAAKNSVTLGGTGSTTPVALKNVATGVDGTDAVNVAQMKSGLSDLREDLTNGGIDLRFIKVNADQTNVAAIANGALAVAIGSGAGATGAHALALGTGARASGLDSVALGYNSVATQANTVSVGRVGNERRIVNVADGNVGFESKDAINGGQLYAAMNGLTTSVNSTTQKAIDEFSSSLDAKTQAALDKMNASSSQVMAASDSLVAIEGVQSPNSASLNGADPATDTAVAIGSGAVAAGGNAVANGLNALAMSNNATAIGSFAQVGDASDYGVAMGSNAQSTGKEAVALGANVEAGADNALAIGSNGTQAVGAGSIAMGSHAVVNPGGTDSIAIGSNAAIARNVSDALALGSGANVAAGANGGIALGAGSIANRGNALSIGSVGAERQIINVAAGTQQTDAVNVSQLAGVTHALGGNAAVGADGSITQPTYTVNGKTYSNVGDAIVAASESGGGAPAEGSVAYDDAAKSRVTLGGEGSTTPVALKNVADGVDDHDAVNVAQLKSSGLVADDGSGNLTSLAVAYDDVNKDTVTLGGTGATDAVALKNVAAGTVNATSHDAINGSQLFGTAQSVASALGGGASVNPDGTIGAPTYTVGGTNVHTVGDALTNLDDRTTANTGDIGDLRKQLGKTGLVDPSTGESLTAVTYDVNPDGTAPRSVTLGGTDATAPVALKNVADGVDDHDAVNVSQLKATGLVGEGDDGKLTSLVVAYDDANKDTVTLGGADATAPVALKNVAAGAVNASSTDAVNGSQLYSTAQGVANALGGGAAVTEDGSVSAPSIHIGSETYSNVTQAIQAAAAYGATDSMAVKYDVNPDGSTVPLSVTLGGPGSAPIILTNVADGKNQYDAVNYGQLSDLQANLEGKIGDMDGRVGKLEAGTGGPGEGSGSGSGGSEYIGGTGGSGDTSGPVVAPNPGTGNGNVAIGSGAVVADGVNNGTAVGSGSNVGGNGGTAIGSGSKASAEGSVAIGQGSVATESNTVSFGNGTDEGNRRLVNIKDGIADSDAATVGQVRNQIGQVQGQINDVSRNAYSGIAAATALTMIPGVDPGKTLSFGIGGATYRGYQAVAFGGEARITQNLKMKAGVGLSSGGNTVGVGASYQW
uniref:beta strand repeat-containing protein n=2 Tax=Burkholderia cenocepacia TaxID=95486 RepID=UPI00084753AA